MKSVHMSVSAAASALQDPRIINPHTSERGFAATVCFYCFGHQRSIEVQGTDADTAIMRAFDLIVSQLGIACPLRLEDASFTQGKLLRGRIRWACRGRVRCTTEGYLFYKSGTDLDRGMALLKMICRAVNKWIKGIKEAGRH